MSTKKVLLMILDGWGLSTDEKKSAIAKAHTPFMDEAMQRFPHSSLEASGLAVGLPQGQMGNSEVGHMNIGAGRVVYQDLVKINQAVEDKSINTNKTLVKAFEKCKESDVKLHFIGLVSDGGVHSHLLHLQGLCEAAADFGIEDFYVHAFTDGRDTDPKSGLGFLGQLQSTLDKTKGQLASIIGRYYAMDRDNRWERVKLAYDAMVHHTGESTEEPLSLLQQRYQANETDEFIKPIINSTVPNGKIEEGDVVICFNFRTDRGREITQALTQKDFVEHGMKKLNLHYVTMTNYDDTFENVHVLFGKDSLKNSLGEVLAANNKKQIRIAETEKYPHVTFFFSGGREVPYENEARLMCPSPKVATYDLKPEMSAKDIRDRIVKEINQQSADFICLNFANPDMVGHTGVFDAVVEACEVVDSCAKDVAQAAMDNDYMTIIISDHGNSDYMINDDGSPNTAHSTSLVPFIVMDKDTTIQPKNGKLGDIAPTILEVMGLKIPKEMTGEPLF
ncbi:MAG: 2,3-bisphosphoglycerate-independent phosphoglycerate mutase [Cyclobacteriaceae bacterium]|nr:2,3-bisphosphoglycerate-independent phosphoglycerate mutase [Cyclobacteriaceae bacterium]MCH8515592.1 2,3-bisphosphoglycerate-independent phosphoglycerate mutase [Cyclobacteriaceae bacterium]